MSKSYQIVSGKDSPRNHKDLAKFLAREGAEFLAPMLELFEQGRRTIDQWACELGKVGIEALLILSADQLAGRPHPGKAAGDVRHHGSQGGRVQLAERRFDERDIMVIYLDGQIFGGFCVITAVGVDVDGGKHVLGIAEGSSENAAVVKGLLTSLVDRGVKPGRRRRFVIDGSKALRSAIKEVYGSDSPVQRCRNHKIENVIGYLPKDQAKQASLTMRAAFRLDAKEGAAKLEQLAEWLEQTHPDAAASLREGLEEMFTINRLGLPPKLCRCLGSTNIIESGQSSVRRPTRRVTRWQDGSMVLRWVAASHLAAEKNYKRIMGHEQLWMLKSVLDKPEQTVEASRKVG